MKKITIFTLFTLLPLFLFAQIIEKGTFTFQPNLGGFNRTNSSSTSTFLASESGFISPSFGYFIADNFYLGAQAGLIFEKRNVNSFIHTDLKYYLGKGRWKGLVGTEISIFKYEFSYRDYYNRFRGSLKLGTSFFLSSNLNIELQAKFNTLDGAFSNLIKGRTFRYGLNPQLTFGFSWFINKGNFKVENENLGFNSIKKGVFKPSLAISFEKQPSLPNNVLTIFHTKAQFEYFLKDNVFVGLEANVESYKGNNGYRLEDKKIQISAGFYIAILERLFWKSKFSGGITERTPNRTRTSDMNKIYHAGVKMGPTLFKNNHVFHPFAQISYHLGKNGFDTTKKESTLNYRYGIDYEWFISDMFSFGVDVVLSPNYHDFIFEDNSPFSVWVNDDKNALNVILKGTWYFKKRSNS